MQNYHVPGVQFVSTIQEKVVSSVEGENFDDISPCNHEEADTRLILHASDAAKKGFKKCLIVSPDSDILILATSYAMEIRGLDQLHIRMTSSGCQPYTVDTKSISASLGVSRSKALPIFHAITGCDVISSFNGKGKKTAFTTWDICPEITEGFLAIGEGNIEKGLPLMEKFVIAMYHRGSTVTEVNRCRRYLFTRMDRELENLPPTANALKQHCRRAAYQGGQVWGQCLQARQRLSEPADSGWRKAGPSSTTYWEPEWTTIPLIQESLSVLVKCGCNACGSKCKCRSASMPCTALCKCGSDCD